MSVVIPYALAWCHWMTLSLPPDAERDCLKIKTARPVGPRTNLLCYALNLSNPCILSNTLCVEPIFKGGYAHSANDERECVSNHRRFECLFNRLYRCRSKKTSKLRATGLCEGHPPVTGEFPSQRASYAENVSIWWRHHVTTNKLLNITVYFLGRNVCSFC